MRSRTRVARARVWPWTLTVRACGCRVSMATAPCMSLCSAIVVFRDMRELPRSQRPATGSHAGGISTVTRSCCPCILGDPCPLRCRIGHIVRELEKTMSYGVVRCTMPTITAVEIGGCTGWMQHACGGSCSVPCLVRDRSGCHHHTFSGKGPG